jgi:hypothetical protein
MSYKFTTTGADRDSLQIKRRLRRCRSSAAKAYAAKLLYEGAKSLLHATAARRWFTMKRTEINLKMQSKIISVEPPKEIE